MLNEEKIRLMTGIAMYEKKAEKEIFPVNCYFKSDYIGSHLIRSFVSYTLTGVVCLALWLLYRFDELLDTMDITVLLDMAKRIGFYYVAGLFLYLVITWWIYRSRYDTASKGLKVYQAKLKRLEKKYEAPATQREGEEGRRR